MLCLQVLVSSTSSFIWAHAVRLSWWMKRRLQEEKLEKFEKKSTAYRHLTRSCIRSLLVERDSITLLERRAEYWPSDDSGSSAMFPRTLVARNYHKYFAIIYCTFHGMRNFNLSITFRCFLFTLYSVYLSRNAWNFHFLYRCFNLSIKHRRALRGALTLHNAWLISRSLSSLVVPLFFLTIHTHTRASNTLVSAALLRAIVPFYMHTSSMAQPAAGQFRFRCDSSTIMYHIVADHHCLYLKHTWKHDFILQGGRNNSSRGNPPVGEASAERTTLLRDWCIFALHFRFVISSLADESAYWRSSHNNFRAKRDGWEQVGNQAVNFSHFLGIREFYSNLFLSAVNPESIRVYGAPE